MIPSLAVVQVRKSYGRPRGVRLWLPLFLLWVPLLLLSPLILLVVMVACLLWHVSPWRAVAVFWGLLCGLSGTDVQVRADGNQVLVRLL